MYGWLITLVLLACLFLGGQYAQADVLDASFMFVSPNVTQGVYNCTRNFPCSIHDIEALQYKYSIPIFCYHYYIFYDASEVLFTSCRAHITLKMLWSLKISFYLQ